MEFFKTNESKVKSNQKTIMDETLPLWKRIVGLVNMIGLMKKKG